MQLPDRCRHPELAPLPGTGSATALRGLPADLRAMIAAVEAEQQAAYPADLLTDAIRQIAGSLLPATCRRA